MQNFKAMTYAATRRSKKKKTADPKTAKQN